ncbi:MAG: hypothetical protein ACHQNA_08595 [Acidimicrobiales bacterium]
MTVPTVPGPTAPGESKDWTVQAADTVESVVLTVKEKTTVPLTTAARGLVYGIVVGVLGIMALILVAVAMIRFLTVYLPVGKNHGLYRVWVSDLIVGGIFTLAGLFAWSKRAMRENT